MGIESKGCIDWKACKGYPSKCDKCVYSRRNLLNPPNGLKNCYEFDESSGEEDKDAQ